MAAEFYHKTAALFEEFKKRELISITTAKEYNSSLNWKNDFSISTQEYLKKINQREKETEKTYKEMMKNMEDLDRQTDQMSLKLEKLHALRNIAISSNSSAWPSVDDTFDRPLQSYYPKTVTNNGALNFSPSRSSRSFHAFSIEPSVSKLRTCDQSTQTEYLFCAQCHFPITRLSTEMSETVKKRNNSLDKPFREENLTSQISSSIPPPLKEKVEGNQIQDVDVHQNFELDTVQPHPIEDMLEISPKKTPMKSKLKFNYDAESNVETILKDSNYQGKATVPMDPLEECSESIEQPTLKSDDESINHEFDFLESNKRGSVSSKTIPKVSFQNNGKEFNSGHDISQKNNPKEIPSAVPVFDKQAPEESTQYDSGNMARIKVDEDVKPDSSVSGGHPTPPFHSENASLASESDTSSEKDTPLTATAAYQALLGNATSARNSQKKQSLPDSDSEDEIEKALAKTVRKSSNVPFEGASEPPLKSGVRKESVAEIKPKPEARGSISSNKPQSKLSKNTRKVLGLDTSSGSEVEMTVAPNTSKKDEDSDEFDFYD